MDSAAVAERGMQGTAANSYRWLRNGREAVSAMLRAIGQAESSVRLETFIYHAGEIGDAFRDALIAAQNRGVRVRVILDAVG